MDDNNFYGFVIDKDIQLDIANKRLIRITSETSSHLIYFGSVSLSDTMTRLLVFLLKKCSEDEILKEDILVNVWEMNNLVSSTQRLWQAIKELRVKLGAIGLTEDFITNIKGSGYSLNPDRITPLLYG